MEERCGLCRQLLRSFLFWSYEISLQSSMLGSSPGQAPKTAGLGVWVATFHQGHSEFLDWGFTHTGELLKEQPKYERMVLTFSVDLEKKKSLFLRDAVCLAGPGDMCVEPSPSGSQISKTSGINLPGESECLLMFHHFWKTDRNPIYAFLLFLPGYEFCFFFFQFRFFFLTSATFMPTTAWFNFSAFY